MGGCGGREAGFFLLPADGGIRGSVASRRLGGGYKGQVYKGALVAAASVLTAIEAPGAAAHLIFMTDGEDNSYDQAWTRYFDEHVRHRGPVLARQGAAQRHHGTRAAQQVRGLHRDAVRRECELRALRGGLQLSLIYTSEPTRRHASPYAVFC